MLAKYFSRKCAACDHVKNNTDALADLTKNMDPPMSLTILSAIKLRYKLEVYNVRFMDYLSEVQDWAQWSNGRIPSLLIERPGSVEKYVGVEDLEELARECVKWYRADKDRRPGIIPTKNNVDLRGVS
jgi:hypothetical protein